MPKFHHSNSLTVIRKQNEDEKSNANIKAKTPVALLGLRLENQMQTRWRLGGQKEIDEKRYNTTSCNTYRVKDTLSLWYLDDPLPKHKFVFTNGLVLCLYEQ